MVFRMRSSVEAAVWKSLAGTSVPLYGLTQHLSVSVGERVRKAASGVGLCATCCVNSTRMFVVRLLG